MKNYKAIIISTLLFVSTGVFAEEHAAAALKHAEQAVTHGKRPVMRLCWWSMPKAPLSMPKKVKMWQPVKPKLTWKGV